MAASQGGPEAASRQLTSWKEIAAYLQRDVRTVQRWEKKEGLPVHRLVHDSRSSVFVTTAELDAWFLQRTVPGGPPPQTPLPRWKYWRLGLAAAVAAASITVTVAWKPLERRDVAMRQMRLPEGLVKAGTPSWDGRFFSYRSANARHNELLLFDSRTGQSRVLYRAPEHVLSNVMGSAASPDGSQVAYMLKFELGGGELRVVGSDGNGERVLLSDPQYVYYQPASWSPDGRRIVVVFFTKRGAVDLGVVEVDTGSRRILHHADTPGSPPFTAPQISPDGRFVAFTEGGDIFVVPFEGGPSVAATTGTAKDALLGWAPDGRLVFESDRSGKHDVWAVRWDGKPGEAHVLWKDLPMTAVGTTKQGDLYFSHPAAKLGLVTAELVDGRLTANPAPLTATPFESGNQAPDFSPDGSSLAYVSMADIDGKDLVLRIRTLATNRERVILLPMPRVDQIRWYRDGTAILIQGGWSEGSAGFYKVAVSAAGTNRTANVSPVLEGPGLGSAANPTFSLDGSALYFKARNAVDRLDLVSGRRTNVLTVKDDGLVLFALSPDQKRIAYVTGQQDVARHQLFVRDLEGGDARLLLKGEVVRPFGGLIWSDSDTILFHRVGKSKVSDHLIRVPLDGTAPSELAETGVIMRIAVHPDGRRLVWESGTLGTELSVIQGLLRPN